ncbi:hypothetical protein IFM89_007656 [Coptis chinensis]|uniref:Uncharacterized protein n=1 Tax=Coptis chinensis TaxID=261450 RepID=A0A835HPC2_9MAGN|nr:hypothetical protein IFM89_007656 [Coptis chinensis]
MAEKQRQDEKGIMKLQNSLQSLQLRFASREQLCRNLQEKRHGISRVNWQRRGKPDSNRKIESLQLQLNHLLR